MTNNEQTRWPEIYTNAMLELEDALLAGRILEARAAISKRLVELQALPGLHTEERQAIADALQGLQSLDREDQRNKAAEVGQAALEKVSSISPSYAPQASKRA
jgi:hypothetical protein